MAKTSISNISIRLGASTNKMQSDFRRASGIVRGFGSEVTAIAKRIALSIGSIVAVNSLRSAVTEQLGAIDRLGKLGDRIGVSVAQLQAYQLQAQLAGTSVQTLEKSLERFVRTMGDAMAGESEAVAGFERLGLSARRLAQMDTAEAFEMAVEQIRQLPTAAQQASAAYDLFGRSGQEMITFIQGGSEAIQQAEKDLEEFGGELSRVDAAKVEEANDAMTRLQTAVKVLAANLTVSLAPALQAAAEALTSMASWMSNLDATTVENTAKVLAFAAAFGAVLKLFPLIVGGIKSIIATLRALTAAQAIASAFAGPAGWAKLAIGAAAAATAVYGVEKAFDAVTDTAKQTASASAEATEKTKAGYEQVTEAAEDAKDAEDEYVQKLKSRAEQITQSVQSPLEKVRQQLAELNKLRSRNLISSRTFTRASEKYKQDFLKASEAQDKIARSASGMRGPGAAVRAGSNEAFSLMQASIRAVQDQKRNDARELAEAKRTNELLQRINVNTRENLRVTTVSM